jgi:DNA-binding SARP family transcriptional activator
MDEGVFIRVLGPLEVVKDGTVRAVGSRHGRALLGTLVISTGHLVSAHRLEAAMWGDAPPPSARASLHSHVSRLRSLLGPAVIDREDHSYRLLVTRRQIDALCFEDLLTKAEERRDAPQQRLELCRQALGLWRGDPFGDLADEPPFRLEALRLDELRLATVELALECELDLGRSAQAAAELESAVQEHPYRERLWYLLIRALEHDGRRVEALRAAQRLRTILDSVGLDASDELRDLEQHILCSTTAEGR